MKSRISLLFVLVCACIIAGADVSANAVSMHEYPLSPTDADIFSYHVFQEPLVPIGSKTTPTGNAALNDAIQLYGRRTDRDDLSAITNFIKQHPKSPWRAALLVNLGLAYRQSGWFLKALAAWEQAWEIGRDATEIRGKALADRAMGELLDLNSRIGRRDHVEALLKQIEHRPLIGSATEKVVGAREGSWLMRQEPEKAFRCGLAALNSIHAFENPAEPRSAKIFEVQSTKRGMSFRQLEQLATELKMDYVVARRQPGAKVIVPSVVNWKAEHYAALVREEDGRFLTKDPVLGGELWVSQAALDAESSGYFLIQRSKLTTGWQLASAKEASRVWGRGFTHNHDESGTKVNDPKAKECERPNGMAVYNFHLQTVSLNITDTPVGYVPPIGPAIDFTATYNQREADQPANFNYSNLGPKWTFNWLSFIQDNSTVQSANVKLYPAGGGMELYQNFNSITGRFGAEYQSGAILRRISWNPIVYERTLSDGSREIFAQSDGSTGEVRKVFLTKRFDPAGNFAELFYDGLRLTEIRDALGESTTFEYDDPCDMYKITKVTDPFKRFATFAYTNCKLTSITDTIEIVSQFAYDDPVITDFVTALTTPYRSTEFTHFSGGPGSGSPRVIEATDPLTDERERVEYRHDAPGFPHFDSDAPTIPGFSYPNGFHNYRNSFYWDKKAMAMHPPVKGVFDYTKARLTQWVHTPDADGASNIKEREKEPLENPVYYFYPGQTAAPWLAGSSGLPGMIAQKLKPDGTSRVTRFERNPLGSVTQKIDPVGRTFTYLYFIHHPFDLADPANMVDVEEVRQTRNGNNELLFSATYNPQHRPMTVTDEAGQTTSYDYNSSGQIETVENARQETTTYGYGDGSPGHPAGYLTSITSPPFNGSSAAALFTYDSARRIHTVTNNPDNYTVTISYDALDRPTEKSYPDGTTEQFQYTDSVRGMTLDLTASKDRLNRWTYRHYNADRQMDSITDPLNRITHYDWCTCGSLEGITDPKDQTTLFHRDLQGRIHQKVFADNTTINYLYEGQSGPNTVGATSRLASSTDALNQTTQYQYSVDDNLSQISYANAQNPTPTVTYTYDPDYNRLERMMDGTGETIYGYYQITSPPALGAGMLHTVDGPLADDVIEFAYDELGRTIQKSVKGVSESAEYDSLGRLALTKTEALGTLYRAYDGVTPRLQSLSYPNWQSANYTYFGNNSDRRLQTLQNVTDLVVSVNLSTFDYSYDAAGQVQTWDRLLGVNATNLMMGYDAAKQLTSVSRDNQELGYGYDPAGNRITDSNFGFGSIGVTHNYTPNILNQIESFTVEAGPISTLPVELFYDLAGNLIDDGEGKTFEWDAANRLTAINNNNKRSEFTYDGLSRRVKIVETTNSTVTSTKQFVWIGTRMAEERDVNNDITRRYYLEGEERIGGRGEGGFYYSRDHLGSIREVTDSSGDLKARFDYDPYGKSVVVDGTMTVDFGYTGHYFHAPSGLNLALYRAYNPTLGRWLNRDPIGEDGGVNLYGYVNNNPINRVDPFGLIDSWPGPAPGEIYRLRVPFFLIPRKVFPLGVPNPAFPIAGCSLAKESCDVSCATEYGSCSDERFRLCMKRCETLLEYCKDTQR